MNDAELTLGELVTAKPTAAGVFHRHGLDFCCGGKQPFAEACAAEGLDPELVLAEIAESSADGVEDVRWDTRPLDQLIHHIVRRYHASLKTQIPRLIDLAERVEQVHADKPDCPEGLADLLVQVREAVESHLAKEEQILFPLILAGRGQTALMPVQVLMQEHEDHGWNLARIRDITNNFALPEYACASWRELYRSLEQLERELMDHIHLENNILFPRALTA
ncbi:MAG: iron-sulfur cluster repair protein YtfE [Pirellulales bacterium]|nr:iron-sulfur cluster repair protein YtfE [Pirellulales bacterium]